MYYLYYVNGEYLLLQVLYLNNFSGIVDVYWFVDWVVDLEMYYDGGFLE